MEQVRSVCSELESRKSDKVLISDTKNKLMGMLEEKADMKELANEICST